MRGLTSSCNTYHEADIPAHSYQLSFESSMEWSKFYAGAPEILKYWQRVADKYNVRRFMKFNHKVVEARWNEQTSKWHVKVQKVGTDDVVEDVGDVLVTGSGVLNEWKWPDIKGLHDFKGKILHSANWDSEYDVTVWNNDAMLLKFHNTNDCTRAKTLP